MKQWNKYDKILFVLVLFIGFGTIGGALTPTRIVAILVLPLLVQKWKSCHYVSPFFVFFVIFYTFCLVSLVWTPDKIQGFKELTYYPIHFLYFFEILVFSKYAKSPLISLSCGWAIMIFFCSSIAIWEITTDQHLSMAVQEKGAMTNVGGYLVTHMTASATFGNPNAYITELCYSFPWIIYLTCLDKKTFSQNIILIYIIIVSIIVIMFNMSRGGLLSFIIMGIVFFLLSPKALGKTITYILLGCAITYILVNYGSEVFLIMEARTSDGGLTRDDARSAIWIACLKLLVNYSFVGVGVGGVTAALGNASNNIIASPHSLFFEVLVQYGVVFTAILLVFLFKQIKAAWKLKDLRRRTVLLMSFSAFPVYTIITSGYLLGVDLFALMGTIYVFINIEKIKSSHRKVKLIVRNENSNSKFRIANS